MDEARLATPVDDLPFGVAPYASFLTRRWMTAQDIGNGDGRDATPRSSVRGTHLACLTGLDDDLQTIIFFLKAEKRWSLIRMDNFDPTAESSLLSKNSRILF